MVKKTLPTVSLFIWLCWFGPVEAQYVLILNNGRQIAVQAYREEPKMIKFQGFGGEIGISRDQIKTIRKEGEAASSSLNLLGTERSEPSLTQSKGPASSSPTPTRERPERSPSPEEERAKEETEYQQRLIDVNDRLKESRDRYSQTIRGTTSSEPTLLTTEEQMKARQDDIISRSLDAQYRPSDPAGTRLVTPSPFSTLPSGITEVRPPTEATPRYGTALPQYTPRQKELSDLRKQTIDLEKEREKLIEEMNQKKFSSGKLFE